MVAKVGRPKSENPRKNNTRIRMTDEEVAMLEYCAEHTGKTKTEILMLGLDKVYNEIKNSTQSVPPRMVLNAIARKKLFLKSLYQKRASLSYPKEFLL
ncbi:TPA: hypothetical protein ACGOVI_000512 [Streptococcus suis]